MAFQPLNESANSYYLPQADTLMGLLCESNTWVFATCSLSVILLVTITRKETLGRGAHV